jgi:excisionase family DNA binding protein
LEPLLVSVEEAARSLGIGQTKAYELIGQGALPCVKLGRRTLVPVRELSKWVDRLALASRMAIPAQDAPKTGPKPLMTSESQNPFGALPLLRRSLGGASPVTARSREDEAAG